MTDSPQAGQNSKYLRSLRYMRQWMIISCLSSFVGILIVSIFSAVIRLIQGVISVQDFWIIAIAVVGAVAAALITRMDPASRGEGIPSYIRGVRDDGGILSTRTTVVKLASSLATLSTWGTGGIVGPLGRVSAGFSSSIVALVHPEANERSLRRTAAVCGLASVVAAVTGAPLGSGVFAVEIIQRRDMRYSDLFPAILTSSLVVLAGDLLSLDFGLRLRDIHAALEVRHLPALLLTVLLSASAARLFEMFYSGVSRLMQRDSHQAVELRFGLATLLAVGLSWMVSPALLGDGRAFLHGLFHDPVGTIGVLPSTGMTLLLIGLMIVARTFAVGVTVGSGQSAGFFSPLIQLGVLIGTGVAFLFGYADAPGEIHLLQAVGFAGLLASSQNVPLAAAIMVSEIFGPHLGFPAALAAILGFQLNRQHTVYDIAFGLD